jgi:hypothetical protein
MKQSPFPEAISTIFTPLRKTHNFSLYNVFIWNSTHMLGTFTSHSGGTMWEMLTRELFHCILYELQFHMFTLILLFHARNCSIGWYDFVLR